MEYLSTLILDNIRNKNWTPFKLKNHELQVSHLLFADDVLLFAKANFTSISSIKDTIDHFCSISGMKINLEKSKLWLSPNITENKKTHISEALQIRNTSNLGSYLGFPLKPNYSSFDFNFIIHKIRKKLQDWKTNLLSFTGRCQLVTSILNQIPNYHIKFFNFPKKNT